jgi:hypothetical protein
MMDNSDDSSHTRELFDKILKEAELSKGHNANMLSKDEQPP